MTSQEAKISNTQSHRIHWLCYQPTPYNDYLFHNLHADNDIDLNVHFRQSKVPSHPWKSDLAQGYNYRLYSTIFGVDWYILSLPFRDRDAFFVIAGWEHLTSQILLTLLRIFKFKYALWTDTPNLDRYRSPLTVFLRSNWLKWIFDGAAQLLATGVPGITNLKKMGAKEEKLINFPFFLDLASYHRVIEPRQYSRNNPLKFISSGQIKNSLKGHDLAIRALSLAANKCPNSFFEYSIAGTGIDEASLKELARKLGLEDRINFLGWTEPATLREIYLNADALIHPSPTHDPFPNAVLEGMAAGLVVFGSDVSGSVIDRVENGVSGFIHQAGNIESLGEQIVTFLNNPESVAEMAASARCKSEKWPVSYGVNIIKSMLLIHLNKF